MAEMTPGEMVAEMFRKPDAQLLLEWIERQPSIPDGVRAVVSGYFQSIEEG